MVSHQSQLENLSAEVTDWQNQALTHRADAMYTGNPEYLNMAYQCDIQREQTASKFYALLDSLQRGTNNVGGHHSNANDQGSNADGHDSNANDQDDNADSCHYCA